MYNNFRHGEAISVNPRHFKVQDKFTKKVYCNIISISEGCFGTMHEVREDTVYHGYWKKNVFSISFRNETRDITCSCHLFEFQRIQCKHAITVFIRNDITLIPERYIQRRWMRDISRAHVRVAMNYDGLVSTLRQLRYDDICQTFSEVTNLTADDEGRTCLIMEWIKWKAKELRSMKYTTESNVLLHHPIQLSSQSNTSQNSSVIRVLDPTMSKRKDAPRKLRKISPLESKSNKVKITSNASKGKRPKAKATNAEVVAPAVHAAKRPHCSTSTLLSYSQLLLVNI